MVGRWGALKGTKCKEDEHGTQIHSWGSGADQT